MNKIQVRQGDREVLIEGETKFVEKHLFLLKQVLGPNDIAPKIAEKRHDAARLEPKNTESKDLLSLYEEKKPSTHYDKIALFGYYLNEQGKSTFSTEDLHTCYLELRKVTKQPGKLEVTIADTIRNTRYIERAGKNGLKLTSNGMNYVLHHLPATRK
jgi:hypothetical protein